MQMWVSKQGRRPWTPMRAPDDKPLTPSSGNYYELALQHGGVRWGLWGWTIWVGWEEFQWVIPRYNKTRRLCASLMLYVIDSRRCRACVNGLIGCFWPGKDATAGEKANERSSDLHNLKIFNLHAVCRRGKCPRGCLSCPLFEFTRQCLC